MRKKIFTVMMAAVLAAGVAGCGSSASEAQPAAAKPEVAAEEKVEESTDTDQADPAGTGKKWVIATDTAFKPFEYTNESGDFVGIDVDILDAVAKDQGFEYELQVLGWDASIAACQAGQADGMIAGASITEERKESGCGKNRNHECRIC